MVCILVAFDESSLFIMIICRSIGCLDDKIKHGESLTDLDSLIHWLSLASLPLPFVSLAINEALRAAQQNLILIRFMRIFSKILNHSSLVLDSVILCFLLANLIHKAGDQQMTPLDVLQFVTSLLFFINTWLQPATASNIVGRAQQLLTNNAEDQIRRPDAVADRSETVRTIRRIKDSDDFFGAVEPNRCVHF
jgi:hypothetical protein